MSEIKNVTKYYRSIKNLQRIEQRVIRYLDRQTGKSKDRDAGIEQRLLAEISKARVTWPRGRSGDQWEPLHEQAARLEAALQALAMRSVRRPVWSCDKLAEAVERMEAPGKGGAAWYRPSGFDQ